jgi:hypothetical protein
MDLMAESSFEGKQSPAIDPDRPGGNTNLGAIGSETHRGSRPRNAQ